MNQSNSPASLLSALPYLKKEKLTQERAELQKRIDLETVDLKKMVAPRWMKVRVPISKIRIYDFYESTYVLLQNKLFEIKCEYDLTRHQLKEARFKFRQYVLFDPPADDTTEEVQADQPKVGTATPKIAAEEFRYLSPGAAPEYYVLEAQFYQSELAWGRMWARANFPSDEQENEVELTTELNEELRTEPLQESFLTNISRSKVWLTYAAVFLAMIPEYLIYSKIISAIFEFSGIKEIVAGTVVILLGKVNAIIIQGTVREFFVNRNRVFRIREFVINRFFLLLFIVSFCYCFAIGLLYKDYKDEQNLAREYVMLQQSSAQLREEAALEEAPSDDVQQQLKENQEQLDKMKSKVFSEDNETDYLKVFTIGFSGAIILLCSSVLFSMALVFSTAYHLRKRVEKSERRLAHLSTHFASQRNFILVFRRKAFRIFCLHGELEFLRRLSEGTPRDVLFDPDKEPEAATPLPLNGKVNHSVHSSIS